MNPDPLDRLFHAARQAPVPGIGAEAYGLETRVLAAWRAEGLAYPWNTALLSRGLLVAGLLMGLSFLSLTGRSSSTNPFTDSLQLADSTVQVDTSSP